MKRVNAYCVRSHMGKSRKKGTPQIKIVFRTEPDGEEVTAYRYFTEASFEYLAKELLALGWDPAANGYDFSKLDTVYDEQGDVVQVSAIADDPKMVGLVLVDEEYTGDDGETRTSTKVKFINSLVERDEMEPTEKKAFLRDLQKRMMAGGGGGTSSARAAKPKAAKPKAAKPKPPAQTTKSALEAEIDRGDEPAGDPQESDFEDVPF